MGGEIVEWMCKTGVFKAETTASDVPKEKLIASTRLRENVHNFYDWNAVQNIHFYIDNITHFLCKIKIKSSNNR